ncbi:MAG TPA: SEC-C metal-binding domain-containing protein [Solirubrobacterales bacterium]|nr:SEC-C metal-binding domain-containing protein [Solirubrobacterales bacterium]
MASVPELLSTFETTQSLSEAEAALDQLATMDLSPDVELGECYDSLAEVAAENDDFALAVRAQRRALEHGCRHRDLGREMLGWYLLKAGGREEGEAVFAALREERPDDPHLHSLFGAARSDSGDWEGALSAFEKALELAKLTADEPLIGRLRAERQECRLALGLPPDEEDRLAERRPFSAQELTSYAIAWFPRDQVGAALERWPDLGDDLEDPDAYCRTIEARLREMRATTGRAPSVAPLNVEALLEFAAEQGLEPNTGAARSRFAALLGRRGETVPWPPGRNDACWCGSGRKYKRCCA